VKDLQEIPANVKEGLKIIPVKWIDKVLEIALERQPAPLTDDEVTSAEPAPAAAPAAKPKASRGSAIKH
jgi:ATP-dependent Lon protease